MDTLHMDHLGPFLTTARKNTHILVTVDAFIKYVWLQPTRQTGAAACIKFAESLFKTYGVPRRIIADRGKAFDCTAFRSFCVSLGIKLSLVPVATPRANGQVERVNSVILDRLISKIEKEEEWDKYLPNTQRYINGMKLEATGKTPNELFFGYKLRHPSNAFFAHAIDEDLHHEDTPRIDTPGGDREESIQPSQGGRAN